MKLIKINKTTFSHIDSIELSILNPCALIVSNYYDIVNLSRKSDTELQFSIEPVNTQTPFIKTEKFMTTIREKIDLSSTNNEITKAQEDKDVGIYNLNNEFPYPPRDLNIGFIELKGEFQ